MKTVTCVFTHLFFGGGLGGISNSDTYHDTFSLLLSRFEFFLDSLFFFGSLLIFLHHQVLLCPPLSLCSQSSFFSYLPISFLLPFLCKVTSLGQLVRIELISQQYWTVNSQHKLVYFIFSLSFLIFSFSLSLFLFLSLSHLTLSHLLHSQFLFPSLSLSHCFSVTLSLLLVLLLF